LTLDLKKCRIIFVAKKQTEIMTLKIGN